MFAKKKNYTHKSRPEDEDASVTTKHCGVDVGSVYCNNTRLNLLMMFQVTVNGKTRLCHRGCYRWITSVTVF